MKEVIVKSLGFDCPTLYYATVDEADKAAGVVGATLEKCNVHLDLHGSRGDVRDLIVECTQEVTKVPFLTIKVKDDKGVETEERDDKKDSDDGYVKRALALKPGSEPAIQKLITERARGYKAKDEKGVEYEVPAIAVDIKARIRTGPKTKTLAKKFQEIAMAFLAGKPIQQGGPVANLKKFNDVLTKNGIGTFVPAKGEDGKELPLSDNANVLALGWLCKAWSDAQDVFKSVS